MKSTPEDPAWNEQTPPYKQEVRDSSSRPPTNPQHLGRWIPTGPAALAAQNLPERSNNAVSECDPGAPAAARLVSALAHIERQAAEIQELKEVLKAECVAYGSREEARQHAEIERLRAHVAELEDAIESHIRVDAAASKIMQAYLQEIAELRIRVAELEAALTVAIRELEAKCGS